MMRSAIFALALVAAALVPVFAQAQPATGVRPGNSVQNWTVEPTISRLSFVSQFDGTAFTGTFSRWTAQIRFDATRLSQSSIVAAIDMASARTGSADRDQSMPTTDWFNVAAFPTATFRSSQINALGPGRYEAVGVLTLRGVSRPLTLPFSLVMAGQGARQTAHARARLSLNRVVFGVGQGPWAQGDVVPAAVSVTLDLTARRSP